MEKGFSQTVIDENIRLKQELDLSLNGQKIEEVRRGRKRSIDFRNDPRDEPTLLRKVRRSSSVPSCNQTTPLQLSNKDHTFNSST